jgi:RecA-family ATPase
MIDDIESKLDFIPADDYDTWLTVGMALKHEGYDCHTWDMWSRKSAKYQDGACESKWRSFNENNAGEPATGGTINHLASQYGYDPDDYGEDLFLGQVIRDASPTKDYKFVDKSSERENLPDFDESKYDPTADAIAYLSGMFRPDDVIGFNGEFSVKDGRLVPVTNMHSFTAGQVIRDIENGPMKRVGVINLREQAVVEAFGVVGDNGCYVRINPLDGHGDGNSNVTRFDNAIIESDEDDIETQYAIYKKLELPIRFLVHSGNHSLHAIVKVDALNINEYRERVSFLYGFCAKNGLNVDEANKNPSRYSRMPGVKRNGQWQRIVSRDMGKPSWNEWRDWVEESNDTLPEDESLEDIDNLPDLAPELIEGILREGHKMLLAAPSKAGKSFLLMELCVCVGEGMRWIGRKVMRGKVLYVNLELDRISCMHRFADIYHAIGIHKPSDNVRVLNLRGRSVPLDKLAPLLIRRYKNCGYKLIVIDPIYKVITGDENAASDMAAFCNLFDTIATECGCAMVYSHHFSKGANTKYRVASDRASGSGVFTRDPDAILSMSELSVDDAKLNTYRNVNKRPGVNPTGWRISSTLREFPTLPDFDVWFDWPLHVPDEGDILKSTKETDTGNGGAGKGQKEKKDVAEAIREQFKLSLIGTGDNAVRRDCLASAVGIGDSTLRNRLSEIDELMAATVKTIGGSVRVITFAGADSITFEGIIYEPSRNKDGSIMKNRAWSLNPRLV